MNTEIENNAYDQEDRAELDRLANLLVDHLNYGCPARTQALQVIEDMETIQDRLTGTGDDFINRGQVAIVVGRALFNRTTFAYVLGKDAINSIAPGRYGT